VRKVQGAKSPSAGAPEFQTKKLRGPTSKGKEGKGKGTGKGREGKERGSGGRRGST